MSDDIFDILGFGVKTGLTLYTLDMMREFTTTSKRRYKKRRR